MLAVWENELQTTLLVDFFAYSRRSHISRAVSLGLLLSLSLALVFPFNFEFAVYNIYLFLFAKHFLCVGSLFSFW